MPLKGSFSAGVENCAACENQCVFSEKEGATPDTCWQEVCQEMDRKDECYRRREYGSRVEKLRKTTLFATNATPENVDSTPDPTRTHAHVSRQRVTSHSCARCMAQVSKVKSVRVIVLCFTSISFLDVVTQYLSLSIPACFVLT